MPCLPHSPATRKEMKGLPGMVYKPSIKQNVFEFQVSGSRKTFSIPLREYINADLADRLVAATLPLEGMIKKVQSGELAEEDVDLEQIVALQAIQRELFETYAPGAYAAASTAEINDIMGEWGRRSQVTMGESQAS